MTNGKVILKHLVKVVFARFLHYEVTFFLSLYTVLFGRKALGTAYTSELGFMLYRLDGDCANYLKTFCIRDLSFLPHVFIYPVIYL